MKRFFFRVAATFVVLAIVIATSAAAFLPALLKAQIEDAFAGLGFGEAQVERVSIASNAIVFENLRLDEDGFSTLDNIKISFNWQALLQEGKFDNLHLSGMTLTSLLNANGSISIAGWSVPEFEPFEIPVRTISFDGIQIDIDTLHGSLRFEIAGQSVVAEDGTVDVQGQIWGEQNQIQLKTSWNGSFAPDGGWSMDMEIQEGRLNLAGFKASRIGGWISMGMESLQSPVRLGGQLSAGMVTYTSVPLQNITATIDGTAKNYQVILDAQAAGTQAMTLHAELGQINQEFFGSAKVKTGHPSDIPGFLIATGLAKKSPSLLALATLPSMSLDATYLADQSRHAMHHPLALHLQDVSGTMIADTQIELDLQKKFLRGNITVPKTSLPALATILPVKVFTGMDLTEGNASIDGSWFIDLQAENPVLEGPVAVHIADLAASSPDFALQGLSGDIVFASLAPLATDGSQSIAINRLGGAMPLEKGKVTFSVTDSGQKLDIIEAFGHLASGRISLSPLSLTAGKPPENVTITLRGLSLAELAKAAKLKDIRVTGKLDGKVDIALDRKGMKVQNGLLQSRKPGIIVYNPDQYPPFLQGDDQRLQIVRDAITHFEYDELKFTFKGSLLGSMQAKLEARGWNRPLFGQRPVHLDLNLEGAIPALLTRTTTKH